MTNLVRRLEDRRERLPLEEAERRTLALCKGFIEYSDEIYATLQQRCLERSGLFKKEDRGKSYCFAGMCFSRRCPYQNLDGERYSCGIK
jgi:hypothetical protein